ncbi:MAG: hypothetical protein WD875_15605 [Pirellulales bacterium]
MPSKRARWRLFVDPEVQGALVTRCLIYWCVCLFVVFFALLSPDFIYARLGLANPTRTDIWYRYAPALVLAGVLTPLMVLDLLRCTNRFVVPMVRTRRFLHSLAQGEPVDPIKFRRSDYWRDYADALNAVLRRMQMLEGNATAAIDAEQESLRWPDESANGADAELVHR